MARRLSGLCKAGDAGGGTNTQKHRPRLNSDPRPTECVAGAQPGPLQTLSHWPPFSSGAGAAGPPRADSGRDEQETLV